MSLNPIQEVFESTQSTPTNNSLSTSSSSASSLSHTHQAPISTSLPSFSSSIYNGPNVQTSTSINGASTPMFTEGHSSTSSLTTTTSQQQNQISD